MIEFSLYIQRVASPSAPAEIPSAPSTPSFEMDKKTQTTKTFKGMPNRFMMTDRCESGTYLLRSVPIDGKYIPTQASNAKKAAIRAARLGLDLTVKVAADMAIVAAVSIPAVKVSVGIPIFASCPNNVDPRRQQAMKQENTVP